LARVVPLIAQLAAELAGTGVRIVLTDAQDTVIAAPMAGGSGEGIFDERPLRACRRRRAPLIVVRKHAVGAKAAADPVVTPFDRQRVALRPHPVPAPPTATRVSRPLFGWDSLTATERTLASIVGQGLTNKQAAARLFVSRHTVDSHLRHIFRKLDINSRVELAALVAKCQPDDERVSA
jgi:DNA-binding CsgD family transcriptional regulator